MTEVIINAVLSDKAVKLDDDISEVWCPMTVSDLFVTTVPSGTVFAALAKGDRQREIDKAIRDIRGVELSKKKECKEIGKHNESED